jgi:hypothetical protein
MTPPEDERARRRRHRIVWTWTPGLAFSAVGTIHAIEKYHEIGNEPPSDGSHQEYQR